MRARSLTISPRSIRHLFPPRRNKEGRERESERNWPQAKALFSREWEWGKERGKKGEGVWQTGRERKRENRRSRGDRVGSPNEYLISAYLTPRLKFKVRRGSRLSQGGERKLPYPLWYRVKSSAEVVCPSFRFRNTPPPPPPPPAPPRHCLFFFIACLLALSFVPCTQDFAVPVYIF